MEFCRFDLPRFFCEAARVLKPGSALVTWGYGLPEFDGHQQATSLLQDFAYGGHKLGPYWSHKRQLIQEEYASIAPDPTLFVPAVRDKVHSHMTWTIDLVVSPSFLSPELLTIRIASRVLWY